MDIPRLKMPDKLFLVDGKRATVREDAVDEFLEQFPSAQEAVSYSVDGKNATVPLINQEEFLQQFPDAIQEADAGIQQTGSQVEDPPEKRKMSMAEMFTSDPLDEAVSKNKLITNTVNRGLAMAGVAEAGIDMLDSGQLTADDFQKIEALQQTMQDYEPSPEFTDYIMAENGKDKWNAFKKAPLKILAEGFGESMVSYLKSGKEELASGALAGLFTGGIGTLAGVGAASYRLEAGAGYVEALQEAAAEKGLELTKEDDLKKFMTDQDAIDAAKKKAASKGLVVGLVDAFTAKVAGSVVAGAGRGASVASKAKRGLAGAAIESTGGGLGELGGQAASGEELNYMAAVDEAVFELGPGAITVGAVTGTEAASKAINKAKHKVQFENDLIDAVLESDPETFRDKVQSAMEFRQISPEQAEQLNAGFDEFTEFNESIPESVSEKDKRRQIIEKIKQRKEVENRPIDEAFEQNRAEEIDRLNNEIKQIAEDEPPVGSLTIPATSFIEDFKLQGKPVELDVFNSQTGKRETVTIDALEAQNAVKDQMDKLQKLRDCL